MRWQQSRSFLARIAESRFNRTAYPWATVKQAETYDGAIKNVTDMVQPVGCINFSAAFTVEIDENGVLQVGLA